VTQLDADAIVEAAVAATDVPDPDTETFRDHLDLLVDAIDAEADLRPAVVPGVRAQLAVPLTNRIEVSHWVREHPEITDEVIDRPIFLTGLPRSGTTYFQFLFDADPSMRMLRTWEGRRPCPPPAADPGSAERWIATCKAEAAEAVRDPVRAKIAAIHLSDVEGPEECLPLVEQTFVNVGHYWPYRVPTYFARCVDGVDLTAVYRHHRLVLQLLQWRAEPRRWVLKWPCHLVALEALLTVYPDAGFVVTHRDPVRALASNCSLAALLRRATSEHVDPHEIGRQMQDMILTYLERFVAFDERFEGRIAHVDYDLAVDEPQRAMADVFDTLGLEMTPDVEAAIVAWRAENPPGKRGVHRYALDDYGLDAPAVAERYAFYTDRYDVPAAGGVSS
jgi:hypothetical protein